MPDHKAIIIIVLYTIDMSSLYIYDPTAHDELSKVRGIGRYMQILHETLGDTCNFTSNLHDVPFESTFLNPFFNILAPPLITKRVAKKQIAVIHDLIPLKYPAHFPIGIRGKIDVFRNKQALKHYDGIITDSEASKKDIIDILKVDAAKIRVIYPIVAKKFFDANGKDSKNIEGIPESEINKASRYCIYVGDGTWNKNLANLAKAINIADVHCIFVGKVFSKPVTSHPWQKELLHFFMETKNDPRYVFTGFVPDDVLIDLYKNAFCNILVSRDEGFGFSYLEAATVGVPSILSDIPVLHETAHDSALFVNPEKPEDIANKITQLKSDETLQKKYSEAAFARSRDFTTARFQDDLQSVCTA